MNVSWPRFRACGAALLALAWILVSFAPASAYTLYGYEDEYGIIHLNEARIEARYVLLYEGERRPKLSLAAIKRLIKERGGASAERKETWIKQHVKAWIPKPYINPKGAKAPSKELLLAIRAAGKKHHVDPDLIYAVMEQESGFQHRAVSPKGAQGLMQLMPETQKHYGLKNPYDIQGNLDVGARYLKELLAQFKDVSLALAAYNAGPGAVRQHNGVPPYEETRHYVRRVLARYQALQGH